MSNYQETGLGIAETSLGGQSLDERFIAGDLLTPSERRSLNPDNPQIARRQFDLTLALEANGRLCDGHVAIPGVADIIDQAMQTRTAENSYQ